MGPIVRGTISSSPPGRTGAPPPPPGILKSVAHPVADSDAEIIPLEPSASEPVFEGHENQGWYRILNAASDKIITDELNQAAQLGKQTKIYGRDDEATAVLDTLIRLKGKNPVLLGRLALGKRQ